MTDRPEDRPEIRELLSTPREELSEVTFTLSEADADAYVQTHPLTDILERIRAIPHDRITQLSTVLRDRHHVKLLTEGGNGGWSDHYSQKTNSGGGGWRDSWKDKHAADIPHDRVPPPVQVRHGPSFDER